MDQGTGKYIILAGALIVAAGLIVYLFHDKLNWIGRLPGDIRIEKGSSRFYLPITTLVIFSILLTLLINIIKKFL